MCGNDRRLGAGAPSQRSAKACCGFTLVEVLVALAVLAVALGGALKGASESATQAAYLREKTQAHWVALNKVAELQLLEGWPAIGIRRGTTELGRQEWHWTTTVSGTPDEDVRRLEVEVRARNEDEPLLLTRVALLVNPR